MKVSPKRLVPEAGCACDCPRRENGSALSAELLPIQKIAPCGWPGLKLRKFIRPPPPKPPGPPKPPPKPPGPAKPALGPPPRENTLCPSCPPFCARIVSIASLI